MTTGYLDDSGVFHDLGYIASGQTGAGGPVLTGVKAGETQITDLYATFTITIQIDYSAKYDSTNASWSGTTTKYYTPNGVDKYAESWIVEQLNTAKATMLLGVKLHDANGRLHLFNENAAYDSTNSKDEPYGDLSLVSNASSPINGYVSLSTTGSFAASNSTAPAATVNFYVYGEKSGGTADTTDVTLTDALDVKVDMPAA